jgi:hypothetical protein
MELARYRSTSVNSFRVNFLLVSKRVQRQNGATHCSMSVLNIIQLVVTSWQRQYLVSRGVSFRENPALAKHRLATPRPYGELGIRGSAEAVTISSKAELNVTSRYRSVTDLIHAVQSEHIELRRNLYIFRQCFVIFKRQFFNKCIHRQEFL